MNAVRHGGAGNLPALEKEMLENVQHQLDLLTKVCTNYSVVLNKPKQNNSQIIVEKLFYSNQ